MTRFQRQISQSKSIVTIKQGRDQRKQHASAQVLISLTKILNRKCKLKLIFDKWKEQTFHNKINLPQSICKRINEIFLNTIRKYFLVLKYYSKTINKDSQIILNMARVVNQYQVKATLYKLPVEQIPKYKTSKKFLLQLGFSKIKQYRYRLKHKKDKGILIIFPIIQRKVNHYYVDFFQKIRIDQVQLQMNKKQKQLELYQVQFFMLSITELFTKRLNASFNLLVDCFIQFNNKQKQKVSKIQNKQSFEQFQNISLEAIKTIGPMIIKKKKATDNIIEYHSFDNIFNIFELMSFKRLKYGFDMIAQKATFPPDKFNQKQQQIHIHEQQLRILSEDLDRQNEDSYLDDNQQ